LSWPDSQELKYALGPASKPARTDDTIDFRKVSLMRHQLHRCGGILLLVVATFARSAPAAEPSAADKGTGIRGGF